MRTVRPPDCEMLPAGTCTSSRIFGIWPHSRSSPPLSRYRAPILWPPTFTADTYSLSALKSVRATSMVNAAEAGRDEKDTSQDGAESAVPLHSSVWEEPDAYVPATQSVHSEAPALEYVPAVQEVQVADAAPVAFEYFPATQKVHAAPPLEYVPAVQEEVQVDAPALEYVPAVQEVHVADELAPVALEYVPASQEAHVDAPDFE